MRDTFADQLVEELLEGSPSANVGGPSSFRRRKQKTSVFHPLRTSVLTACPPQLCANVQSFAIKVAQALLEVSEPLYGKDYFWPQLTVRLPESGWAFSKIGPNVCLRAFGVALI